MSKKNKNKNNKMCNYYTVYNHIWIKIDDKMFTTKFNKIFKFFVIFSPCKRYATQGRTLEYYGWKTKDSKSKSCLNNSLNYSLISKNIICVDSYKELYEKISNLGIETEDFTNIKDEKGIFIRGSETSYFMSMFYHIRCALAHGRFTILKDGKNTIYYFENGQKVDMSKFKVSARIVIYESTLLKYIKLIMKQ